MNEARGLCVEHLSVAAIGREQGGVRAVLDDVAGLEDDDAVRAAHGGEAVRDDDRGQPARDLEELIVELGFGAHVEMSGRFIEDQDAGAGGGREQRSGEREPLPLAIRDLRTVAILTRQPGVPAVRKILDYRQRASLPRRVDERVVVVSALNRSERDVVSSAEVVASEVLEDRGHAALPGVGLGSGAGQRRRR